jgi:uncharacterized protein (UPF0216 family)
MEQDHHSAELARVREELAQVRQQLATSTQPAFASRLVMATPGQSK